LSHIWLDGGYKGEGKGKAWIEKQFGWTAEIVQHPPKPRGAWARPDQVIGGSKSMPPGFRLLSRRWVFEHTFSGLCQSRRLSKDYEWLSATSEALIYIVMTRLILRRLTRR
jgi:transposase